MAETKTIKEKNRRADRRIESDLSDLWYGKRR